jgi:filamentous hemagglutinin
VVPAGDYHVGACRLVGADRAIVEERKLVAYALDPTNPVGRHKARVFDAALGYTRSNCGDLLAQIREGVMAHRPIPGRVDEFGARFTVDMPVRGPAGQAVVRTGWIYDRGSVVPRLVTLYVT